MAEQARFCDECGARLERSTSKFCTSCGAKIPSSSGQQRTEETNADVLQEMGTQETRRQEEVSEPSTRLGNIGALLKGGLGCLGGLILLWILLGVCNATVNT